MKKSALPARRSCTGAELVSTTMLVKQKGEVVEVEWVQVKLCHSDATMIAQVRLPCGSKELCDACFERYTARGIATRILVDLAVPLHKRGCARDA